MFARYPPSYQSWAETSFSRRRKMIALAMRLRYQASFIFAPLRPQTFSIVFANSAKFFWAPFDTHSGRPDQEFSNLAKSVLVKNWLLGNSASHFFFSASVLRLRSSAYCPRARS